MEMDLHRLELRYADVRLMEPRTVAQLAVSIERCGQIIPCVAVAEHDDQPWILIDGYRRVAALKQLGRDTVRIERWTCDLTNALTTLLSRAHGRAFKVIEEALLMRELVYSLGISQQELARRCGRDGSWVCRRLQLVCALSDAMLNAVRAGQLSTWAATRVLLPLARANAEHAEKLLLELSSTPLTTREWRHWFEHYQRATRETRERLVTHPRLFLDASREAEAQRTSDRLRAGFEGEWLADVHQFESFIARLKKRLPTLAGQTLCQALTNAFAHLALTLETFHHDITSFCSHDQRPDPHRCTHA
jgi:ParB-like chromosome segregation protein Spo0J